jgi:hypothetical protein
MIKFPSGKINLDSVDKWIIAAIFLWCVESMILKHIVISITNIWLKEGIMQNIVLKINIILTFKIKAVTMLFLF